MNQNKKSLNKSHPWHGVQLNKNFPSEITCYIELTPFDTVKYEIDKDSGILKIDRPQQFSNTCPTLYGFVPRTLCSHNVASVIKSDDNIKVGDLDPLDVCILTEKPICTNDILLHATPIGGFRMIDDGKADDKIIAVLKDDLIYGDILDIKECNPKIIERLKHYFLTYKKSNNKENVIFIQQIYDREIAMQILIESMRDYRNIYGNDR